MTLRSALACGALVVGAVVALVARTHWLKTKTGLTGPGGEGAQDGIHLGALWRDTGLIGEAGQPRPAYAT